MFHYSAIRDVHLYHGHTRPIGTRIDIKLEPVDLTVSMGEFQRLKGLKIKEIFFLQKISLLKGGLQKLKILKIKEKLAKQI